MKESIRLPGKIQFVKTNLRRNKTSVYSCDYKTNAQLVI